MSRIAEERNQCLNGAIESEQVFYQCLQTIVGMIAGFC